MQQETIAGAQRLADGEKTAAICPITTSTLELVRGKWKPALFYHLSDGKPHRFGALQRRLGGHATPHTLAQQLRELEHDGLVHRQVFAEVPPRVEYVLTEKGLSLLRLLEQVHAWGQQHGPAAPAAD